MFAKPPLCISPEHEGNVGVPVDDLYETSSQETTIVEFKQTRHSICSLFPKILLSKALSNILEILHYLEQFESMIRPLVEFQEINNE